MIRLCQSSNLVFLTVIAVLIAMNFASRERMLRLNDLSQQVKDSRQRLLLSEQLVADLNAAAVEQHGYLMNRMPNSIASYNHAIDRAHRHSQELGEILERFPERKQSLEHIDTILKLQTEIFPKTFDLHQEWETIPELVEKLSAQERTYLAATDRQVENILGEESTILLLGGMFSAVLALLATIFLEKSRHKKELSLAEQARSHDLLLKQEKLSAGIIKVQQRIATADPDSETLMNLICKSTTELTEADAAVVEMIDGEEIVCEAIYGKKNPPVGMRVSRKGNLSGLCIEMGEALVSHDTETDPRVDREVSRRAHCRSILVLPLLRQGKIYGVLKASAHHPNHFNDEHIRALSMVAGILSAALSQASQFKALREAERALIQARDQAETGTRAKSSFLANMSHEIRTPLNGILGIADFLAKTELNREQRDCLQTIEYSGESLLNIINDILDFSKIEAGMLVLANDDFNLKTLLQKLEKIIAHANATNQVDLIFDIHADLHSDVKGDQGRLMQILLNLVGNAMKFTPDGQVVVVVKTTRQDGHVIADFEIQDTGVGIPPEAFDKLFKAFQQADSSNTRQHGGTGLGLSICKHLISQMDGHIGVQSQVGKGSTFWFNIKLKEGKPVAVASKSPYPTVPKTIEPPLSARLLLVEDNLVNQKIVMLSLEDTDLEIFAVGSGRDALLALEQRSFDLILMDCQMPDLDGYETTRLIRALDEPIARVPIIALTANAIVGDREKCLACGMDDYVSKPFKAAELKQVVTKWLNPAPDFDNLNEIIEAYLLTMPQYIRRVENGFSQQNWKMIADAAHPVRSSSANLGAHRLSKLAEMLESQALEFPESITSSQVGSLRHEYEAIQERLQKHLKDGSADSLQKLYPLKGSVHTA